MAEPSLTYLHGNNGLALAPGLPPVRGCGVGLDFVVEAVFRFRARAALLAGICGVGVFGPPPTTLAPSLAAFAAAALGFLAVLVVPAVFVLLVRFFLALVGSFFVLVAARVPRACER